MHMSIFNRLARITKGGLMNNITKDQNSAPTQVAKKEDTPINNSTEMIMCIPKLETLNIAHVLDNSLVAGGRMVHDLNRLKVQLCDLSGAIKDDYRIAYSYLKAFCYAGMKNNNDNLPVIYLPREYAEQRDDVKQIVVGAFIHSDDKILLMECLDGDMENSLTLVEGHVGVPEDKMDDFKNYPSKVYTLKNILEDHIARELSEELIISDGMPFLGTVIKHRETRKEPVYVNLKYLSMIENKNINPISFKHIGFIFDVYISNDIFENCNFKSNESCNRVKVIDAKGASNAELFRRYDDWVKDIVNDWM